MASHGNTTTISWGGATIGSVTNIGGVELKAGKIDITALSDTFKKYMADLPEASDIPISGFFDQTDANGQIQLATDIAARTSRTAVITLPGSIATWTFTGFVTSWKVGEIVNGVIPFSATIAVAAAPVLALSASNNATALTITTATLYPTFAQGTYSYVGTSTGTGLTFTPTFAAGTCSITNGTTTVVTTSTVASGSLALGSVGTQTTFTMTIQETNKVAKVYTFVIAKTA